MDVLDLLTEDHAAAKALFEQLEDAEGAAARKLWDQLDGMLSLHEELEETLFYPRLKNDDTARDIVLEGYQEHHVMDVLIEEIGQLEPSAETWAPKIKVLKENTEHHIQEEEEELFPKVRKIWNAARRQEVGREMQALKDKRLEDERAA